MHLNISELYQSYSFIFSLLHSKNWFKSRTIFAQVRLCSDGKGLDMKIYDFEVPLSFSNLIT